MLYKVRVFHTESEPQQWDSLDGVGVVEGRTPDLVPLGESVTAERMQEALLRRSHVGRVPSKEGYVYLACDGVGLLYASVGDEETRESDFPQMQWTTLSRRGWRAVGGLYLRVEQVRDPAGSWRDALKNISRWRRFINFILWRRCGNCLYFDQKGAHEWRTKVTHVYGGISGGANVFMQEAMNDDVTKIAAAEQRAPDFRPGEFGYCPRRDCGLSARLPVCSEYRRA